MRTKRCLEGVERDRISADVEVGRSNEAVPAPAATLLIGVTNLLGVAKQDRLVESSITLYSAIWPASSAMALTRSPSFTTRARSSSVISSTARSAPRITSGSSASQLTGVGGTIPV